MNSLVGKVLHNRYRIDVMLGRGGMAEVYKVWDRERAVYLAMKLLHQDMAIDRVFIRRFQREANTLQKLNHPNIVRFYDFVHEGTLAAMLLEFISGWTLKQMIHQADGPMSYGQIRNILSAVCVALQYAHSQGVVHSDIKPANIMIDQQGKVLLADFGIARMTDAATATMVGAGTPAYMAPEQIKGEDPKPQTDVYALGVVLYEMLTGGERPFTGENATSSGTIGEKVRWEQINLEPSSPQEWNSSLHDEIVEVVMQCLEKDPEKRFQTPLELLNAFDQAIIHAGLSLETDSTFNKIINELETSNSTSEELQSLSLPGLSSIEEEKPPIWKSIPFRIGAAVLMAAVVIGVVFSGNFDNSNAGNYTTAVSGDGIEEAPNATDISGLQIDQDIVESSLITETSSALSTETPEITNDIFVTSTPVNIQPGFLDINSIDQASIVFIPSVEFTMGLTEAQVDTILSLGDDCLGSVEASTPTHQVYLDAYWIYETEVTNQMYQKCVQAGACDPPNKKGSQYRSNYFGNPEYFDYPVVMVSWNDADAYCQWAGGRLPTSAEWEYAARGNDGRLFPWGDQFPTRFLANYDLNVGDTEPVTDWPEGVSPFGLYHMAGNVYEWVGDWYSSRYYQVSPFANPTGPTNESGELSRRVLRGGSWGWDATCASSGVQDHWDDYESGTGVGFRCVIPYIP